jgi:hypothetical protein
VILGKVGFSAFFQNMIPSNFLTWPPIDYLLPSVTAPCLLYAGERGAVKIIPHATFVSIPSLVHTEAFVRSDLILPHVKRFLSSVTGEGR